MRIQGWVALSVGVVGLGAAVAQMPKVDPVKPAGGMKAVEAAKPAESLAAMLAEVRTAYGKVRDYSGTFTRQERLNGKLTAEQVAEMKMRVSPAGVSMRFARPEGIAGMEVAYSAARRDGKVHFKPASRGGAQRIELDDTRFLAENRHPVSNWGMGAILDRIETAAAREKALNNPVEMFIADYQFAGRNVTRYEIYMRRGHAARYAAKMVVFVDRELKLPVRFEAYDEPKNGAATGELFEAYSFSDLKINPGIGENAFDF